MVSGPLSKPLLDSFSRSSMVISIVDSNGRVWDWCVGGVAAARTADSPSVPQRATRRLIQLCETP